MTVKRAAPLPLAERRALLAAVTLDLIREHGTNVSTRQIAAAAGVAEGTIFRAFATKDDLVEAAVQTAFDPAPTLAALSRIDPGGPLEDRLRQIVQVFRQRLEGLFQLMAMAELRRPPQRPRSEILERVADLVRSDADSLRCTPEEVAHLLRLLVFAGSHPVVSQGRPLSTDQIIEVLMHGVCASSLASVGTRTGG